MNRARLHSHYDILRVDRGASADHVRSAYRRMAQKFHPDKHHGKRAAAVVMAQINQAYEVLSDPAQRSAYDDWLAREDSRSPAANAPVFTPDRFGWGNWLVFATTSLAVLTVGYVVIATWTPVPPASRPAVRAQASIEQQSRETSTARQVTGALPPPPTAGEPARNR